MRGNGNRQKRPCTRDNTGKGSESGISLVRLERENKMRPSIVGVRESGIVFAIKSLVILIIRCRELTSYFTVSNFVGVKWEKEALVLLCALLSRA